jgi:phospholipase/carboxylesterase
MRPPGESGEQQSDGGIFHRVRPAEGPPDGALVLFHGRGADEDDLFGLIDVLDPGRRLVAVTPRGPLTLPPGGAHWYAVRQVGYPDEATFAATYERVGAWLDGWLVDNDIEPGRAILGGFSQGAVMSYSLGLGRGRPRPAGIIALSGFIPVVAGWELDPATVAGLPVAIGHGTHDPVIEVGFGRAARDRLAELGADITFTESPIPHTIDPSFLRVLRQWVGDRFAS